jgi:hypothetical protein
MCTQGGFDAFFAVAAVEVAALIRCAFRLVLTEFHTVLIFSAEELATGRDGHGVAVAIAVPIASAGAQVEISITTFCSTDSLVAIASAGAIVRSVVRRDFWVRTAGRQNEGAKEGRGVREQRGEAKTHNRY